MTYEPKIPCDPFSDDISNREEAEGRRRPRKDWMQNLQVSPFLPAAKKVMILYPADGRIIIPARRVLM